MAPQREFRSRVPIPTDRAPTQNSFTSVPTSGERHGWMAVTDDLPGAPNLEQSTILFELLGNCHRVPPKVVQEIRGLDLGSYPCRGVVLYGFENDSTPSKFRPLFTQDVIPAGRSHAVQINVDVTGRVLLNIVLMGGVPPVEGVPLV
ncbi:hypothetical protein BJ322DRAFT_1020742 [Thelephora terrestris]|uniref:Uncharacterized protein n=1 Tax=Thelephora terrestris TaxID=56493 RepID=A0A9P6HEI6_9AGAM|nr:hypothetical protein BJ322DRAFT_1020742 [Thelephora terrestris]